jgi:hypothetical protein
MRWRECPPADVQGSGVEELEVELELVLEAVVRVYDVTDDEVDDDDDEVDDLQPFISCRNRAKNKLVVTHLTMSVHWVWRQSGCTSGGGSEKKQSRSKERRVLTSTACSKSTRLILRRK